MTNPICQSSPSAQESAYSHLLQGQTLLAQQHIAEGLSCFLKASELAPHDPKIHLEQGLSLLERGTGNVVDKKMLRLANKAFKIATLLDPISCEAWQFWGISLMILGQTFHETHFFLEADKKFIKAKSLLDDKILPYALFDLYYAHAQVQSALATRTKEPSDWQTALHSFNFASTQITKSIDTQHEADFWHDFGRAYLALTETLGDKKWCAKAINCCKQALTRNVLHHLAWECLSQSLIALYAMTQDEDHFFQTNDCFSSWAKHFPLHGNLWLAWAEFLLCSARETHDLHRVNLSIEKSQQALSLGEATPNMQAKILACLGEALSFLGELSERVDLIHEGQNKIAEALELSPHDPLLWRSYGASYISLGVYFADVDYLCLAIEKFQEGLSIDRTKDCLWHAIGAAYTTLGTLIEDPTSLQQALHFLSKATDLNPRYGPYLFTQALCLSKLGELTQEEPWLASSLTQFERALHVQKSAIYLHPEWLFQYAKTLDLYADFFEEDSYYHKALDVLSHVMMIDPDFPKIHYHIGLICSHLGELSENLEHFYKALHFFKLATKHTEENDQILVDLSTTLINIATYTFDPQETANCYVEAETKLLQAAKAGNLHSYYQLACLASILGDVDRSLIFLYKAETFHALPSLEELLVDEWLERARSSPAFTDFLSFVEQKSRMQEEL